MTKLNNIVSRTLAALTLGVVACSAGSVANAQTFGRSVTVEFRYDQDVSVKNNYRRIKATARGACGNPYTRPIALRASTIACADDLIEKAVAGFGITALETIHLAETGRSKDAPFQLAGQAD